MLFRWWNDLGFTTKHTFIRDRIVEAYFWILGVYFEPQYSKARMMMVKVIAILSVMDDAYDSYGTLPELQLFTLAIQRSQFSLYFLTYVFIIIIIIKPYELT